MKASILFLLLFTLLSLSSIPGHTQLSAEFTASITEGCRPQFVQFTPVYPDSLASYFWEFGNQNSSFLQGTVSTTYDSAATYIVSLTVSKNGDSATSFMSIAIFENPTAGFNIIWGQTEGCSPLTIQFADNSVPASAPITSWDWSFGDWNTLSNPYGGIVVHTYISGATCAVSLIVTDSNTCHSSYVQPDSISVYQSPQIGFYANPTQSCTYPLAVQFTNINMGSGTFTYDWDFGDGGHSIDANPMYTYSDTGLFTVSLVITEAQGCSTKVIKLDYIVIQDVVASFTMPDTACANIPFSISNTSIGANNAFWEFDTTTTTSYHPQVSFYDGGVQTVTCIASLNGDCPDTLSQTIFIDKTIAGFSISPDPICNLPMLISFTNNSQTNNTSGPLLYNWTFDGYGNSNDVDPEVEYLYNLVDFYDHNHSYGVTLSTISPFGCTNTATDMFTVCFADTAMMCSDSAGCIPLAVTFWDSSIFNCPTDNIVSWVWDFGNGTSDTGKFPLPTTYTDTGIYFPTCTLTTGKGCDFVFVRTIFVGELHNPVPFLSPLFIDSICASDTVVVLNNSTDTTFIDSHIIMPYKPGISNLAYSYPYSETGINCYFTDTGWHTLGYTVTQNECASPMVFLSDSVYVLGPVGQGQATYDCLHPDTYTFDIENAATSSFIMVDSFYWDFGDGSPIYSDTMPITHTYQANSQDYAATFHTFNYSTGCSYVDTVHVWPSDPVAKFSQSETDVCTGVSVTFDPINSSNYRISKFHFWPFCFQWNFGDGYTFTYVPGYVVDQDTFTMGYVSHIFDSPGEYNVRLIVYGDKNCPDTCFHTVTVHQPNPQITADPQSGCAPLEVGFENVTTPGNPIIAWLWDFGQGTSSANQHYNNPILYDTAGNYVVSLTAVDTYGCIGNDTIIITASSPIASFEIQNQVVCLGDPVYFTNTSITYGPSPIYTWYFGDDSISNEVSPHHSYQDTGAFSVMLVVDDEDCRDTLVYINAVAIIDSVLTIVADYDTTICAPVTIKFKPGFPNFPQFSYIWDINGSPADVYAPGDNVNNSGQYTVILNVMGSGCFLSDTLILNFGEASAYLTLSDVEICKGEEIKFTVNPISNVGSFVIDFADGTTMFNESPVYHKYTNVSPNGFLYPKILCWNPDSTCKSIFTSKIFIYDVDADFNRGTQDTDSAACEPARFQFFGHPVNGDNFEWDFGDNSGSTSLYLEHTFDNPGEYEVTFEVYNYQYTCSVSKSKMVYVYPKPVIDLSPDAEICLGDSIQLYADGGEVYLWSPDLFINNNTVPYPFVWPIYSIDYNVSVTDSNKCANAASIPVFVQQEPVFDQSDTFYIVVGDQIDLPGEPSYSVEYSWAPAELVVCPTCYNPGFVPLFSTTFYLTMNAYAGNNLCFTKYDSLYISVDWKFSIDVPDLFTPNGDGNNDVIFVEGRGIKELIEFRVFNRWGQEVFYTEDKNTGWDGIFNGQAQPIDTYTYMAKVLTYENKVLVKNGVFTLMR